MLQEHLIHLDLQLVGLEVDRADQAHRELGVGAETVVDFFPGVNQGGVLTADLLLGGAQNSPGDIGHAGEPLLLEAADVLLAEEGEPWDHDDIAPGHVLTARPGGGDGRGVPGGAAAHDQDLTFGIDRDLPLPFQNCLTHKTAPFKCADGLFHRM